MNITKIEVYRFSISMVPFTIATGIMDRAQNIFIRVHTDEGFYGVGECSAFPMIVGETQDTCWVLAESFAHLWLGKDASDIEARLQELDAYIAGNTTIKSAFDMSLYDLAAKRAGQPLYEYLGGQIRPIVTDITVGIDTPEHMAQLALEWKHKGVETLKVKLGKKVEDDITRIQAIREAIGYDMTVRIDANQGWSFEGASKALKALEEQNIQFCEQPMRRHNDRLLPELRKNTSIPIMADESCYNHHDALNLIHADACDYINIKLSKSGGIQEALNIHAVAQTHGIPCMIGGMLESRIALSAKAHLACACPNIHFFDLDTCLMGHLEDPVKDGIQFNQYQISIPALPGIGADADDQYLKGCESKIFS